MVAGINGASNERNMKNTSSYDTSTGELVANKTPAQVFKTQQLNKIKNLTKQGKHGAAQKLYKQIFPDV